MINMTNKKNNPYFEIIKALLGLPSIILIVVISINLSSVIIRNAVKTQIDSPAEFIPNFFLSIFFMVILFQLRKYCRKAILKKIT